MSSPRPDVEIAGVAFRDDQQILAPTVEVVLIFEDDSVSRRYNLTQKPDDGLLDVLSALMTSFGVVTPDVVILPIAVMVEATSLTKGRDPPQFAQRFKPHIVIGDDNVLRQFAPDVERDFHIS